MKGLFALAVLAAGFAIGSCGSSGGSDPTALCKQAGQKTCDLLYDCAEGQVIRDLFPGQFPATKADCLSQGTSECAMPCATGETYHGDQAQMCANALNGLTCSALSDPNLAFPASCDLVCQ